MYTTPLRFSREFQAKCPSCKRESVDVTSNNRADGLSWSIHFRSNQYLEPLVRCDMSTKPYERPARNR